MRCHYEVLQVSENATIDELKKSYRRLALKCHPDKNQGREEAANEEFKEVCQAYTTLSDPQERAFYDRNKESILSRAGAAHKADTLDVFAYFTTSCYPGGYTDATNGFYTVYRELFQDLADRDMKHMAEDEPYIPSFGDSLADLEDVAVFYGYWASYCTSMPFAWADKTDINQASCRYVEKIIERENKKCRDKERKQFNEQVRNLVLFVRKRDPRWKERTRQLERRSKASAEKRLQTQLRQQEERQEQLEKDLQDEKLIKAKQEYLKQLEAMERQMRGERSDDSDTMDGDAPASDGDEDNSEQDEEDLLEDELICVVCVKMFTSERTKELHMRTKKHKQKLVMYLQEQTGEEIEEDDDVEQATQEDRVSPEQRVPAPASSDSEQEQRPQTSQNKKDKKKRKQEKKMQKLKKKQQPQQLLEEHCDDKQVEDVPAPDIVVNLLDMTLEEYNNLRKTEDADLQKDACQQEVEVDEKVQDNSKTKLKPKKAKQVKQKPKTTPNVGAYCDGDGDDEAEVQVDSRCMICQAKFPSKNKLFQHIKATGHAMLKDGPAVKSKGKQKRK